VTSFDSSKRLARSAYFYAVLDWKSWASVKLSYIYSLSLTSSSATKKEVIYLVKTDLLYFLAIVFCLMIFSLSTYPQASSGSFRLATELSSLES